MNARTARPDASAVDGSGEYTPPSLNRKNTAFGGIAVPLGTRFPTRTNRVRSIAARHINTSLVVSPPPSPSRVARKPSPRRHRAPLAPPRLALAVSPPFASSRARARAPYTHSSNFVPIALPRPRATRRRARSRRPNPDSIPARRAPSRTRTPRAPRTAPPRRSRRRPRTPRRTASARTPRLARGAVAACSTSQSGATSRANPSPSDAPSIAIAHPSRSAAQIPRRDAADVPRARRAARTTRPSTIRARHSTRVRDATRRMRSVTKCRAAIESSLKHAVAVVRGAVRARVRRSHRAARESSRRCGARDGRSAACATRNPSPSTRGESRS